MSRHLKIFLIYIFALLLLIGCQKQKQVERFMEDGVEVVK